VICEIGIIKKINIVNIKLHDTSQKKNFQTHVTKTSFCNKYVPNLNRARSESSRFKKSDLKETASQDFRPLIFRQSITTRLQIDTLKYLHFLFRYAAYIAQVGLLVYISANT
jgi:hypothetical protein